MALNSMSLVVGSSADVSGHTDPETIAFKEDGQAVANGVHLVVAADNFQTRRQVVAKVRPSAFDSKTQTYSKEKKSLVYVIPENIDGKIVFHTMRLEMEIHPLTSSDKVGPLLTGGAALLLDPSTVDFWQLGAFR